MFLSPVGRYEDDFVQKFRRCRKSHDHDRFVLVKDLKLHHLPKEVRHPGILDFVKWQAKRTVHLQVRWTSRFRPERFGMKNLRGKSGLRTGTGTAEPVEGYLTPEIIASIPSITRPELTMFV